MADTELGSLETRIKGLEMLLAKMEERVTAVDQLQAVIITMYAEMFAGIEALASVVSENDAEAAEKLNTRRDDAIKALWRVLGQQAESTLEEMDDDTRAAMENFVRGTQASSN